MSLDHEQEALIRKAKTDPSILERLQERLVCKYCGAIERWKFYCTKDKAINGLCFKCDFWTEKLSIDGFRIDGHHYMIGRPGGFGGRWFRIKKGDKIIETNCLWAQGKIPEHFRSQLPDNATFLNMPTRSQ